MRAVAIPSTGMLVVILALAAQPADDARPSVVRGPASTASPGEHWASLPLARPDLPAIREPAWARNSIDQFVLAKLEAGLLPLPRADRGTLIRRVTFDLTGLPPTPEEVDAFVRDESPDAYEKLLDRLLASPAYGERWAQHWLDLARFAETDGFEHDLVRPNAWRYRDWVIDALNADMPYDEFVRLQIAGDARADSRDGEDARAQRRKVQSAKSTRDLAPLRLGDFASEESLRRAVATGFLLAGPDMPDINLQEERRHNVLNEMTGAVGSVFLGLQLGCAQCHDHKSDPISQADFYAMRAFFEPAEFFDEAPLATPEQLAERERLEAPIKAQRDRIEKELKAFDAMAHERLNKDPQVKIGRDELVSALSETERDQFQKLVDELKTLNDSKLPPLPMARMLRERGGAPRPSRIMIRGDFRQPGPEVSPAFLPVANLHGDSPTTQRPSTGSKDGRREPPLPLGGPEPPLPLGEGSGSDGRRAALARWLTMPDHPLTARVIVNRVWQFHFGSGLVRTPSDFGTLGEPPSHPELLDWLATEFTRPLDERDIDGRAGLGWSLKRLHRVMLTSATYMQASRPTEAGWTAEQRATATERWKRSRAADPENRLLARMNRQRLDGEAIRDAMLAASDRLSRRRGGPGVRPPLPEELTSTLLKGQWTVTPDEEDHRRRSIYIFVRRNLRYPLFDVFDRPDTNASCPQRPRSTTAPQSLTLLNSEFSLAAARDLAGFVLSRAGANRTAQVQLVFERVFGRRAAPHELHAAERFLIDQPAHIGADSRPPRQLADPNVPLPPGTDHRMAAALTDLCLAMFNLNEFVYVD